MYNVKALKALKALYRSGPPITCSLTGAIKTCCTPPAMAETPGDRRLPQRQPLPNLEKARASASTVSSTNATCSFTRPSSAPPSASACVIDGLMHNDVVKSDIHSTDTHGCAESDFRRNPPAGFLLRPRIKTSRSRTSTSSRTGPLRRTGPGGPSSLQHRDTEIMGRSTSGITSCASS